MLLIDMIAACYIDIAQARLVLAEMGIDLSDRQIKRAAEPDSEGRRKLPFFKDPIDGRLKLRKVRWSASTESFKAKPRGTPIL
jgi:hypothetical protein